MIEDMDTTGRISVLLAHNRVAQASITDMKTLAGVANVPLRKIYDFNAGREEYIRLEHLHNIGRALNLASLGPLLGMDHPPVANLDNGRVIMQVANAQNIPLITVSQKLNIPNKTLLALDTGKAKLVKLAHVEALCDFLGINVNVLLRYAHEDA